jgi:hypothetical protein
MIFRWIVLCGLSLTISACSGLQNSAEDFVAQESKRLIEQIQWEQNQSRLIVTKRETVVDVDLFPQQVTFEGQGLAHRSY